MHAQLAVLAVFVFLYSLVSKRLERTNFSGPMMFVAVGFILGPGLLGWFPGESPDGLLRWLADLTLALFLFIDAANADLPTLRKRYTIPARMLLFGLPGAMLLGFIFALALFDSLSAYEAAILAVMLAATDAALGKAVVTNPAVPSRLREGLNVESGLNDGLCVPFLFLFIALELGTSEGTGYGLTLLAEELGIGLLVGLGLTAAGGALLRICWRRSWVSETWLQMTTVALAFACFAVAQSLHGSGYIAAFTGGMLYGFIAHGKTHKLVHSAEGIGEVLALLTWMLFGVAVVGSVLDHATWTILVYSLLSLTVVRMLPNYLALIGSGEPPSSRLFLGWFGPRGMASIVFAIIVLEHGVSNGEFIALVVACTVLLSLILHGISANPLARWIAGLDREQS
ncbi:cation:proton antiporter [Tropicimonas sediminicola]|uniref:Sodium/proton antiporter, CPA1 family n=1 Tax=Tropicimonas sediminicola TaxID=1031541 RepID=A0A239LNY5_9RHOB|nr:cation:proton antiporter [Tropicimonas sediminicola]SNT31523.1 sodium/proton antiporter, CPA1 family [Tropicimonas sediminicola]